MLAGETKDFSVDWTPPSDGVFHVSVGLVKLAWSGIYGWNNDAIIIDTSVVNPPPPPPPASTPIYLDALQTGWVDWSWLTTTNPNFAGSVNEGTKSMQVTFSDPWSGFYLHNDALSTAGKTTLSFAINGNTAGGQALQLRAYDAANHALTAVNLNTYVAGTNLAPNTWVTVNIPLADLGIANATFTGFVVQGRTGVIPPIFLLDNIRLQ